MKFTERFNEYIKISGIKQADIARYCKTTRQNISNFKAGRSYPSIETLYLICQCLDVTADYLLGLEDENGGKTYISNSFNNSNINGGINFK